MCFTEFLAICTPEGCWKNAPTGKDKRNWSHGNVISRTARSALVCKKRPKAAHLFWCFASLLPPERKLAAGFDKLADLTSSNASFVRDQSRRVPVAPTAAK
jgi:hypothetical protein